LSDVDLIIIENYDLPFFQRIGLVIDLNPTNLEIEPLIYTESKFNRMIEQNNVFIAHILEEGIEV